MIRRVIFLTVILAAFAFGRVSAQCNQTLVTMCTGELGENTKYLRQYRAKLGKGTAEVKIPVARFSVLLSKGTHYRFKVCSAQDYEGEAILQLFDKEVKLASTYHAESKTNFMQFDFVCNKTAIYDIYISFKDGKPGCAVGILSMVMK